jgi:Xaa-Pro aminopeptidase
VAGGTLIPQAASAPPRIPLEPLDRRAAIRERIAGADVDAFLVLALPNVRYLSGFSGSAGILLVGAEPPDVFFTDFRYQAQVAGELDPAIEVRIESEKLMQVARDVLSERGAMRVAFEREQLSYRAWSQWSESEGPALVPAAEWVEEIRMVKAPAEIDAIRRACKVADATFESILGMVRPGVSERELAARLDLELSVEGAERPAFETIVAFGERSALPHARPGSRQLRSGEVVLFDFGAVVDGYVSDMTRTVACGEPPERLSEIYAVVLESQETALGGIAAGVTGPEADALARDVIERAGFGSRFGHSLGHGIGLEVHEAPRLSRKSENRLASGMTVTVEPGIYLEGIGGVRIEDDALIGERGVEVLSSAPKKDLIRL